MSAPPDNSLPNPDQMADLLDDLAARTAERDEARAERQGAIGTAMAPPDLRE